jgi:polyisoprenoid-binding protein YceI
MNIFKKYLDATRYSELTFNSTRMQATNLTEGMLAGNFSMHGVTK